MPPLPPLSPEQRAELSIQREMDRRTNTSIFDPSGNLRMGEAQARATKGEVYLGEYLHIGSIPWAPDPYGSEHCVALSRLVEYMASLPGQVGGFGPFDAHDTKVLHAVAMLYCVGMGSFGRDEPPAGVEGYEERSAAYAEKFFRSGGGDGTYWSKESVREETCRLIFQHNREDAIRSDKRLQVFADAVRYETTRLKQNTGEGMALLQERCTPDKFFQGWAKDKANFRGYMLFRGWR